MNGIEERKSPRAKYKFDIYYPHVNNKSVSENIKGTSPVITVENISDSGICFSTKLKLTVGDFISFLFRIGDYPSFNTLAEVKWIMSTGDNYQVGCQFYTLTSNQISVIREYVSQNL